MIPMVSICPTVTPRSGRYVLHGREAFGDAHDVRRYGRGSLERPLRQGARRDRDTGGYFSVRRLPPGGVADSVRSRDSMGYRAAAVPGTCALLRLPRDWILRRRGVRRFVQMVEEGLSPKALPRPPDAGEIATPPVR